MTDDLASYEKVESGTCGGGPQAQTASVSRIVSRTKPKTIKQNAKRLLSRDYDLKARNER